MAIKTALVSVGVTATVLADPNSGLSSAAIGQTGAARVIVAVPAAGQTVYVGGPDVTASGATQGLPIATGTSQTVLIEFGDILYGIVAATTQNTNVFRSLADDN